MSGLFLLMIIGVWLWLVVKLSRLGGNLVANKTWSSLLSVLLFVVLLPLPVIDEIVGGFQFRKVCNANAAEFHLEVANPEGRAARVVVDPSNQYLKGTAIPIRRSRVAYVDEKTSEPIVSFDRYVAEGGVLIRALGISENKSPLTIGQPNCSPERAKGESANRTFKLIVQK